MSTTLDVSRGRSLRDFALELGYEDSLLAEGYPVWSPGRIMRPDLVGFASRPLDMTTATLVAEVVPSGDMAKSYVFRAAEALAAPAVATLDGEGLQLWWLGRNASAPAKLQDLRPSDSTSAFATTPLGRSLHPDSLLQAKRGTIQPSLFPLDVEWIQRARGRTEAHLDDLVAHHLNEANNQLKRLGEQFSQKELVQLVLSAFTFSFIRDRSDLARDSVAWTSHIRNAHPSLARWQSRLSKERRQVLETVMSELQFTVNLSSLDPALMSNVYEKTLVSKDDRAELGVVYTPTELARQLINRMPFEEIAPENRKVLDPTCGSGTLLLASHDRLRDLVSKRVSPSERHRWVVGHLTGWDKDPFAVEVARLCLTLNSFPEGNGWRIEQTDALTRAVSPDETPTIIVGNPPWKAARTGPEGGRSDLASVFLERALQTLAPEGILGMVMPGGWLSSNYSEPVRRHLRESCEVLEVWRLPERTFRKAEAAPAVVIAKKTNRVRRTFHLERRVLSRSGLPRFYMQGVADSTNLVQTTAPPAEKDQRGAAFMARPLTGRVSAARWKQYVSDVARLRAGPPRHKGAEKGSGTFLLADKISRRPYFARVETTDCVPVRWPEDFDPKSAANPADFSAHKLLLTGKIRPDSPWSSRVRVDTLGVVPTDGYIMVIPQDFKLTNLGQDDAIYALAALFASTFASAWIDERRSTRNISPDLFRNLPLPPGWERLTELGRALSDRAGHPELLLPIVAELDDTVFRLYGLSSREIAAFASKYAGIEAPEDITRFAEEPRQTIAPSDASSTTYGAVLDLTPNDMTLWAPGITPEAGAVVAPPPRLPGSLLFRGADFKVRADAGRIADGEFWLHASSWRSPLLTPWAPTEQIDDDDPDLDLVDERDLDDQEFDA